MIPRSLADHAAPVAPVVSLTPRPGAAVGDDKLGFIDALRGLTAVSIVFFHTALLPQPTLDIGPSLKSYVYSLFTGVQCFYAISAFTLALSHQRKRHEFMHGTFFLLRRLFRAQRKRSRERQTKQSKGMQQPTHKFIEFSARIAAGKSKETRHFA